LLGASVVERAKPGASVLAENPNLLINGHPAVVAATQRYGAGQVMVLAGDTTWRWTRFTRIAGQSDTLYARFWSQTLRWLSGRSRDDKRPLLSVSTDRPDYEVNKQVTIRVAKQPRPDTDLAAAETNVEVVHDTGKSVPVQLRANSQEPN